MDGFGTQRVETIKRSELQYGVKSVCCLPKYYAFLKISEGVTILALFVQFNNARKAYYQADGIIDPRSRTFGAQRC